MRYKKEHPTHKVPTFKTIYRYIHSGDFVIKPIDLPLMMRLKSEKISIPNLKDKISEN